MYWDDKQVKLLDGIGKNERMEEKLAYQRQDEQKPKIVIMWIWKIVEKKSPKLFLLFHSVRTVNIFLLIIPSHCRSDGY